MLTRRLFLGTSAAASIAAAGFSRALNAASEASGALTPEMFGAKGDGRTDDSAAFAALSAKVNALGGGTVVLRRTTYLVGTQRANAAGVLQAARILAFSRCTRALVVQGNGAKLRCAEGQRYGAFEPNGAPSTVKRKGKAGILTPYRFMLLVEGCSGGVSISDLELDGNLDAHVVGGRHGDTGWQIGCTGVALRNNSGSETLSNVYAHHHAQDGFYIDGPASSDGRARRRLTGLRADANGRQGMSIVGGQGYEISNCAFTRTARGKIASAPRAGLDIEAERGKKIRNLTFSSCRFVDNRGCGLVADSGDSADVRFVGCTFIGTDNWSVWPDKPGFRFEKCLFAGSIVHAHGDPDPARATQFIDCTFSDDPALSPTGQLVLRKNLSGDLPHAQNVLFERCSFRMEHAGVLPWSKGVIWSNCTMTQRSPQVAYPRGIYRGTNRITGHVNIGKGSRVEGTLIINGRRVSAPPS